jgi:hypothetical protein
MLLYLHSKIILGAGRVAQVVERLPGNPDHLKRQIYLYKKEIFHFNAACIWKYLPCVRHCVGF